MSCFISYFFCYFVYFVGYFLSHCLCFVLFYDFWYNNCSLLSLYFVSHCFYWFLAHVFVLVYDIGYIHMLFSWITLLSQSSCHISDRLFAVAGMFLLHWLCDFYHFYSCLPFISMSLPLFPQVSNSLYRSDSLYWLLPLYRSLLVSNSLYTLYQFLPISLVCWAVTFELNLLNSWTHW